MRACVHEEMVTCACMYSHVSLCVCVWRQGWLKSQCFFLLCCPSLCLIQMWAPVNHLIQTFPTAPPSYYFTSKPFYLLTCNFLTPSISLSLTFFGSIFYFFAQHSLHSLNLLKMIYCSVSLLLLPLTINVERSASFTAAPASQGF